MVEMQFPSLRRIVKYSETGVDVSCDISLHNIVPEPFCGVGIRCFANKWHLAHRTNYKLLCVVLERFAMSGLALIRVGGCSL